MDEDMERRRRILGDLMKDQKLKEEELFRALKANLGHLETLWARSNDTRHYEDPIYRFYHNSYKVFALQGLTLEIVEALQALLPGRELNSDFLAILAEGTGKTFTLEVNQRWGAETRPILEAFFHARYFLEMAVRYGRQLQAPPSTLPSGWAAFLYLYNLR